MSFEQAYHLFQSATDYDKMMKDKKSPMHLEPLYQHNEEKKVFENKNRLWKDIRSKALQNILFNGLLMLSDERINYQGFNPA